VIPAGDRSATKAQRLRVRFSRDAAASAVGHLDLSRLWERALAGAGIAVSYSESAKRQPRITVAAGLPHGATSDGELLDVVLAALIDPASFVARVQPCLPDGIRALEAWEVGIGSPSLPALIRWACYEVDVAGNLDAVRAAIDTLLAAETLPWVDRRGEKVREYDLRSLVSELRVEPLCEGHVRLSMRLRASQERVGRPDQVLKALGLPDATRTHRTRLVISESSPARTAWRRKGRYQ
jgi:radical SAM-linked protein